MTMTGTESPRAHDIDIQWGLAKSADFPEDSTMVRWVEGALSRLGSERVAISVRMMTREEIATLNEQYRDKAGPTNVLSFPADGHDEEGRRLLGDIAISTDVVASEANEQKKALDAHMAHMLIHGVLHLAGYDHNCDDEAQVMESLETELLDGFGFPDPYEAASP